MLRINSSHTKETAKVQLYVEGSKRVEEIKHLNPEITLQQAKKLGKKLYWGSNGPDYAHVVNIQQVPNKKRASNWLRKLCAKKILIADDIINSPLEGEALANFVSSLNVLGYDKQWILRFNQRGVRDLSAEEAFSIIQQYVAQLILSLPPNNIYKEMISEAIAENTPEVINLNVRYYDRRLFLLAGEEVIDILKLPNNYQPLEANKKFRTEPEKDPFVARRSLRTNPNAKERINYGKGVESHIINELNQRGFPISGAEKKDDVKGIDGWWKSEGQSIPIQVKYRDSGDDLVFVIMRDYYNQVYHTDWNSIAQYYFVLAPDGQTIYVAKSQDAKNIINHMMDMAKRDGWQSLESGRSLKISVRQGVAELRLINVRRDKVYKLFAFISPDALELQRINLNSPIIV